MVDKVLADAMSIVENVLAGKATYNQQAIGLAWLTIRERLQGVSADPQSEAAKAAKAGT